MAGAYVAPSNRETALNLLVIVAVSFFLSLPMVWHGFWPFSGDAQVHLNWYYHFSKQFWEGDFYPRWLMDMNDGLGSPIFFYYPPVSYFITSLFKPVFYHDPLGWKQLGISVFLGLAGSGITCFIWLKNLTGQCLPALIAAVAYMLMPYHLGAGLYLRGAFAEFWSYVWMPLVLYYVHRVHRNPPLNTIGLAVSYALLIMTHIPTTLIFSLVPLAYAWKNSRRLGLASIMGLTVVGMLLGIGLSAIYLLPAMTMQHYATMEELTRVLYYKNSFLLKGLYSTSPTLGDEFNMLMFWVITSAGATAIVSFLFIMTNNNVSLRKEAFFWASVTTVSILMMFTVSDPVWRLLTCIQIIQFPWRFGTVLCVSTTALFAMAVQSLCFPWKWTSIVFLQFLGFLGLFFFALNVHIVWPRHCSDNIDEKNYQVSTLDAPEYCPSYVKSNREIVIQKYGFNAQKGALVTLHDPFYRVNTIKWKPRKIELFIATSSTGNLLIHHFYYPGWTAKIDGITVEVRPSIPDGLIELKCPAGWHHLTLRLLPNIPEQLGKIVSIVTLALLALYYIWRMKKTGWVKPVTNGG